MTEWGLYRTSICRHVEKPHHDRKQCSFAHCFAELNAPIEVYKNYGDQWGLYHVDRFYGQKMSREQVERIARLWENTFPCFLVGPPLSCCCTEGTSFTLGSPTSGPWRSALQIGRSFGY